MADQALHKKYPKWSHRKKQGRKKKLRRIARRIVRARRKHKATHKASRQRDMTNVLLLELLKQLNVKKPAYTPLFSRDEYARSAKKRAVAAPPTHAGCAARARSLTW